LRVQLAFAGFEDLQQMRMRKVDRRSPLSELRLRQHRIERNELQRDGGRSVPGGLGEEDCAVIRASDAALQRKSVVHDVVFQRRPFDAHSRRPRRKSNRETAATILIVHLRRRRIHATSIFSRCPNGGNPAISGESELSRAGDVRTGASPSAHIRAGGPAARR
jgi:hypothetical protein